MWPKISHILLLITLELEQLQTSQMYCSKAYAQFNLLGWLLVFWNSISVFNIYFLMSYWMSTITWYITLFHEIVWKYSISCIVLYIVRKPWTNGLRKYIMQVICIKSSIEKFEKPCFFQVWKLWLKISHIRLLITFEPE